MAKPQRNLLGLSAIALRDELAAGSIKAAELTEACIEQIAAREDEVKAWCWHDPAHAREQAALLDRQRSLGLPLGPCMAFRWVSRMSLTPPAFPPRTAQRWMPAACHPGTLMSLSA